MDYLDPAKKRAHSIRLFIGYALMAVLIGTVSLILLYQARGYDLDRKTGKVIQNGLIYVDSEPVASRVNVNGQDKGQTDMKLIIPSATYNIELKAAGYRSWKKTVRLEGSSIEQLTYPFLFPTKLTRADRQLYAEVPQLSTQSPDRRWLMVIPSGSLTRFDVFDIDPKQSLRTAINLPADLFTAAPGAHSLSLVEWSRDNKHLLIKHTYQGGSEFVMIDRTVPTESLNLSRTLSLNPTTAISLRDKLYDRYYLYDSASQALSTVDLKDRQIRPLLIKVLYFKTFGANQIVYVTTESKKPDMYTVNIWDGNKKYFVHDYPAGSEYKIDTANFSGANYLVISSVNKGASYLYKDALGQAKDGKVPEPFRLLRLAQPKFISFSTNARFIAIQSGNNFAVYDIDMDRRFYYQLTEPVEAENKATWMDGHRLTIVSANQTNVFDFDGTNHQKLTASYVGLTPFFSPNYNTLYNLGPSVATPNSHALTSTPLLIEP
jgi:hypothetical protein